MFSGYCAGWSLRTLLTEGLNGVPGKMEAAPPKHMSSAVGQIVNFLGTLQNEWAGAQAFSLFDTYMAPFVRKDGMDYAAVRQCMQEMIYNLNVPSRWGTQTPCILGLLDQELVASVFLNDKSGADFKNGMVAKFVHHPDVFRYRSIQG